MFIDIGKQQEKHLIEINEIDANIKQYLLEVELLEEICTRIDTFNSDTTYSEEERLRKFIEYKEQFKHEVDIFRNREGDFLKYIKDFYRAKYSFSKELKNDVFIA